MDGYFENIATGLGVVGAAGLGAAAAYRHFNPSPTSDN